MTFDPHAAVVGAFDGEFVVDPRALDNVDPVAALPPHRDGDGLLEWLDRSMPVEVLPAIRARRVESIRELVLG